MSNHNTNRVTADDYGIYKGMPIIPDTMVATADYARRLRMEDVQHAIATGERIPNTSRLIRIATELGHPDADTQQGIDWVMTVICQGEAILWDRELRAMDESDREEALRPYVDPNFEATEGFTEEQLELLDDLTDVVREAFEEAEQRNSEIQMLREMFGD